MKTPTLFGLLLSSMALGQVPATIAYQGRLLGAGGAPLQGTVDLRFAIFEGRDTTTTLWCENQRIGLSDGYYAVQLGTGALCPSSGQIGAAFSGGERYLEIAVNGSVLSPRQQVGAVPYALSAQTAQNVSGGTIHAIGPVAFAGKGTVTVLKGDSKVAVAVADASSAAEVLVGDLITIDGMTKRVASVDGKGQSYTLTVDGTWPDNKVNTTFHIQRPVTQVSTSDAAAPPALLVNAKGDVGLGTFVPAARLDVNGTIKGGGVLAGVFYSAPTSVVSIVGTDPAQWGPIEGSTLDIALDRPATIVATYSITVEPAAAPVDGFLAVRLAVDGTPYRTSGSHVQPFCTSHCNEVLHGSLALDLLAGPHAVSMQWQAGAGSVTWSNNPGWADGYGGGRTISVLAFYK